MKCDSVPLTVKLADLWLGYKWKALDYSLKDVPGRRMVLCSELVKTLEKCKRKEVINRRSRRRTGLPNLSVENIFAKNLCHYSEPREE
jgi:hypothetical protein